MNGLIAVSESIVQRKCLSFDEPESWSLKDPGSYYYLPSQGIVLPFIFHCFGGKWNGQIQELKTGLIQVHLEGMPPVQIGQTLHFEGVSQTSAISPSMMTGKIQHVHIQRGVSVWEGATVLLVSLKGTRSLVSSSQTSQRGLFQREPQTIIIGRMTENNLQNSESELPAAVTKPVISISRQNAAPEDYPSFQQAPQVQSVRVSIRNGSGQLLMGYHDYPIGMNLSSLPVVVLAPGYGETKRDSLTLAYYFVSNGFHVIRYDHTNHVGESEGCHFDISLSSMKHDFTSVIQFVQQQWPQSPVIGVASSLAGRVALKAEAEHPSLALLVLLVGIVDVQQSVSVVHQEDVFANFRDGQIQDSANILGFNVGRQFLHDAIQNNFDTLASTIEDGQSLQTPLLYISAGKDAWIKPSALATFQNSVDSPVRTFLNVPEALHRLQENPKLARTTYRQIIHHCWKTLGMMPPQAPIHEPNRAALGKQNRQEKMAQTQASCTDVGPYFWHDYLGKFQTVSVCQDYVQLLDHMFHALGPIKSGERILDAGCGNGNGGLFLLRSLLAHPTMFCRRPEESIQYVGIDVVKEALGRAHDQMTQDYRVLKEFHAERMPALQMSWAQVNLQQLLPFEDHQFDRIISNLVVGYMGDPQAVLRELYRVLAPGGRMVISNLKPHGDFSGIYHNLINRAQQGSQKTEARDLLNNYGKIRQAEMEGQFRFFDPTEWRATLEAIDCVHTGVYPTFANQAYLIVLEKPRVSILPSHPINPVSVSSIPTSFPYSPIFTHAA